MKVNKIFILVFVLFCIMKINAQQDTFKVKTVRPEITVLPERLFIYLNEDNYFQINYKGKHKLGRVECRGGTVEKADSIYNVRATTGVTAILVVYERLKNGTEQIAYSRTYKLYGREVPVVTLDGVPNDSFAEKFAVIALGRLKTKQKSGSDAYAVTSFVMYFSNGIQFDTLKATGNQMTSAMKRRVDAMDVNRKGGVLMFDAIKAKGPHGKEIELPPLRIYLQDGPKLKAGL
ncbi:MAG TPA: hypothetical protein VI731_09275 [Bacteroidia bacterium]|nr:hypothetical protein [Bacteroidia bacterium]